jgi:hypothetical protein
MIATPASIAATNRKLNRRAAAFYAALRKMHEGNALHYSSGGRWTLSDGSTVHPDVAAMLVKDARVVDVGDSLFPGLTPSQTYRYVE